jgi:DNA topoisomerase-3
MDVQLVIAEKPSVARDLARVLGVRASGEHCFEGERCTITWCIGHLVELDEPASYNPQWRAWRLENLPMLPEAFRLRGAKHARGQLRAVAALLRDRKRFTGVINACDAGREGELIFRYVYQYASSSLPVQRLWVSSLTDEAIRRGFAQLRPGAQLDPLADAARSRSEADWLVGMNATRAVTARGRDAGHDALYSIGRVQTPTLAMIVAREREIRAFVPRPYWEVRAELQTAEGERFVAHWRALVEGRLASRLSAQPLADSVVARDREHARANQPTGPRVERTRARTVREPAPMLFDLTSLQRTANRRFGFSAARTLEIAQALYERHKVLTYPRTDSRHLSTDVAGELPQLFASLASIPEYEPFASPLVAQPPHPSRRVVDDTKVGDHHAIIPTSKPARLASLDRDESRIYDLVVRRFLGVFYPDAEFAVTEAWIRVGPGESAPLGFEAPSHAPAEPAVLQALPPMPDRYLARGRVRTVPGWQPVAGIEPRDDTRDRDQDAATSVLPPLVEGQRLEGRFAHAAKQTTPPPRYTEASLLGAMESAGKSIDDEALRAAMRDTGLGTPATRAAIIETLLRRSYIVRDRQNLVPTSMGVALIGALPVASLASPELTGAWEARLARIARGEDSRSAFMADIVRYVAETVDAIRTAAPPSTPPPGSDGAPPPPPQKGKGRGKSKWSRGGSRSKRASSWSSGAKSSWSAGSKSRWQGNRDSEYPEPNVTTDDDSNDSASPRAASNGAVPSKRASTSKGPTSTAKKAPAVAVGELQCPACRQASLIAGSRGWGCSRWREGCRFVIWFETAGRRVTAAQLRDLVTRGKTRKATFEPEQGVERAGRLVLDPSAVSGAARFEPSA